MLTARLRNLVSLAESLYRDERGVHTLEACAYGTVCLAMVGVATDPMLKSSETATEVFKEQVSVLRRGAGSGGAGGGGGGGYNLDLSTKSVGGSSVVGEIVDQVAGFMGGGATGLTGGGGGGGGGNGGGGNGGGGVKGADPKGGASDGKTADGKTDGTANPNAEAVAAPPVVTVAAVTPPNNGTGPRVARGHGRKGGGGGK